MMWLSTKGTEAMGRISLYAALLLGAALAGCGSPVNTAKSTGPAFDPSNPGGGDPTIGVNDSAGFFLKVTSDTAHTLVTHRSSGDYTSASHPVDNFAAECRILNSATGADRDIVCLAEVEELDLYFSELKVQYHVPRDMCRYLRHNPYHFWESEPGTGVTTVAWNVRNDGTFQNISNSAGGKPVPCVYDYSSISGPNCCVGTYTKTVGIERSASSGGGFDYTTSQETWGGKASNCLFGPATDTQKPNGGGFPKPDIFYVEGSGLNKTYTIKPAIDMSFFEVPTLNNIWAANFYNRNEHTQASPSVPPLYNINRPIPTRLAATYTGYLPSDTYDFSCLDAAEEVKFRIRLMIREWNQAPIVEGGNPDVTGVDPGDGTAQINDRLDWKDVQTYPGTNLL
jgi:hypothetical protein